MPVCPRCHEEYVSHVTTCADCGVPLVSDAPRDEPPAESSLAPVEVRTVPELRELVASVLRAAKVPCREDGGSLWVPAGLRSAVLGGLARVFRVEDAEEALHVVEALPPPPAEHGKVLQWTPEACVEQATEAVPLLRDCVRLGDAGQRRRAFALLGALERSGKVRLQDLLLRAVREGSEQEVFRYCSELREREEPGAALAVAALLGQLDPERTVLALHALGRLPDPRVAEAVLPLLQHESPEVREEADEVLCWIADRDFGFDAEASPEERAAAVGRWRAWLAERDRR